MEKNADGKKKKEGDSWPEVIGVVPLDLEKT